MSAPLSLRFLSHAIAHAQSFFSPAVPGSLYFALAQHIKNRGLAHGSFICSSFMT